MKKKEMKKEYPVLVENEKEVAKPSKALIKLFKKLEPLQEIIPTPITPNTDMTKITKSDKEFYYEPVGITKNKNVIEFGDSKSLSVYDHLLIQKGDFSKNYIYDLLDLVRTGIISEHTFKNEINAEVYINDQTFRGYIATIVLDLITAYMSYMFEIIKKEFPEFDTITLSQNLLSNIVKDSYNVSGSNSSIYQVIYQTVYREVDAYNIPENSSMDNVVETYTRYHIEIPNKVIVILYDNIHIKLCNMIGIIGYETVEKIMTTIVNDCLTSLHDAISHTIDEILTKIIPIFVDQKSLRSYVNSRPNNYDDEFFNVEEGY